MFFDTSLRRILLAILVLAAGRSPAVSGVVRAAEAERPHIILMMSDDQGWEETGYNGHPYVQTPVLDQMAASGLRLDRFYAAHPSCSPTRGSFLTGRHPNRYGTFAPNWSIRPEEISLGHLLSDAGYYCGHFGKWHVGPVKADSPTNPGAMGFHEWLSHDNFFEMDPPLSRNGGPPEIVPGEGSEVLIDETLAFIQRAREAGKPFFALVWFGSPHEPYSGVPEDLALYDDLPGKYTDRMVRLTSNETGLQVQRPQGEVLRERYAEITAMDRAIGRLREFLDQQGLRENTILFFCSDNGTSGDAVLASPLRGRKGQLYDGGVRVPAVLEWPRRIDEPQVSHLNASTSDIFPTLAALLQLPLPDRPLDGENLLPLFEAGSSERTTPIFFWSYPTGRLGGLGLEPWIDPELQQGTTPLVKLMGGRATRDFRNFHHPEIEAADYRGPRVMLDNRYKLIMHNRGGDRVERELFDLREDPAETTNLIAERPETAAGMEARLQAWQDSVLRSLRGGDYEP